MDGWWREEGGGWKVEGAHAPNYQAPLHMAVCLPPLVQDQQHLCTLVDQMPSKQLMARINSILHQTLRMFLTDYCNY